MVSRELIPKPSVPAMLLPLLLLLLLLLPLLLLPLLVPWLIPLLTLLSLDEAWLCLGSMEHLPTSATSALNVVFAAAAAAAAAAADDDDDDDDDVNNALCPSASTVKAIAFSPAGVYLLCAC